MAREETKRITGRVDKSYVEVVAFKYDQDTRLAAAKALNEKTGSFKGWADEAKSELNTQLKNEVEAAFNLSHFKDFKVSLLSRCCGSGIRSSRTFWACCPRPPAPPGCRRAKPAATALTHLELSTLKSAVTALPLFGHTGNGPTSDAGES